MSSEYSRHAASKEWDIARRKALLTQLSSYIRGKDVRLRDFADISRQLHLRSSRYVGIREVPIDKIVGSVGRYSDFIRSFLPVTSKMEQRWEHIAEMYIDPVSEGLPPIECYKVGNSYFVKDGNHRVSVARQLDMPTIEAHVWEYNIPIAGIDANTDIDTLLLKAEREDFFNATGLETAHLEHQLELTLPGGYRDLLHQICDFQHALEQIDDEAKTFQDAAAAWYELRFEPSIQIIQREGVMGLFPDRTAADLFIWTHMEQERLESRYKHRVRVTQAIQSVKVHQRPFWKRLWESFRRRFSNMPE